MARTDKPGTAPTQTPGLQSTAAPGMPPQFAHFAMQHPSGPAVFPQGMAPGRPASGQEMSGGTQPSQTAYAGQMTPQMLMFVQQQQAAAALAAQQQQQQRMAAQQQQQGGVPAIARPPSAGAGVAHQGIAASPLSGIQHPARAPTPPTVPSASGRATPTGQHPPTNFTLPTRQGNENVIRHMPIPQEFLREHPAEWPAWVADPAKHAMTIYQKFLQWAVARNTLHMQAAAMQQRQQSGSSTQVPPRPSVTAPAAKRPRVDASQVTAGQPKPLSSSTGAMTAQIPPSTQPPVAAVPSGLRLPASASPSPPPQITVPKPTTSTQQAASAALPSAASSAASALQARIQARPNMPPIIKPASEEDKSFLPRARAQKLIRDVCGTKVKPTPALVAAIKHIASDFVTGAVAFGTAVAKQRKSESLEAADLHLYFQKAWDIHVPGFGGAEVVPYRRPVASEVHRGRAAAIRSSQHAGALNAAAATGHSPPPTLAVLPQQQETKEEGAEKASGAEGPAVGNEGSQMQAAGKSKTEGLGSTKPGALNGGNDASHANTEPQPEQNGGLLGSISDAK